MDRWWESIYEAHSHILSLSSILVSSSSSSSSFCVSSLADRDDPAHSLLTSADAYSTIASALSSSLSGSFSDPLCRCLYDAHLSSVPALSLLTLSFLPLLSNLYLARSLTDCTSVSTSSLAGFESILLVLYNSEIQSHNDESLPISIPDLSQPSLYHTPFDKPNPNKGHSPVQILSEKDSKRNVRSNTSNQSRPSLQVKSVPFEPQNILKSTERAHLVEFTLNYYYKKIAQMPRWSKIEFCKVVAAWAGPCRSFKSKGNGDNGEIANIVKEVRKMGIEKDHGSYEFGKGAKILLPWELLQPVLKILAHCLLGPFSSQDIKDAASVAVKKLQVRATHDLDPRAILATQNLFRLDKRAREEATKVAAKKKASKAKSSSNKPQNLLQGLPKDCPPEGSSAADLS